MHLNKNYLFSKPLFILKKSLVIPPAVPKLYQTVALKPRYIPNLIFVYRYT